MVFCLRWFDHRHQNNSRLATKDINGDMSQTIFSDAKNPLSHTGHTGWTFFFIEEAAAIDIVWIRYLSSGPQRTLYHRLFTNVPSIRCLSSDLQTKKPSKLRSKDIRIVFLQRQTVFQDFPPKLDLLTIVMLIGIRHCQVTVPNYCDNDCMFVMFISSSNEEKYA